MIFRRFSTTFRRFPKIFQNCPADQTNERNRDPGRSTFPSEQKTYCTAFCASPVALLAGSGHNASCNDSCNSLNRFVMVGKSGGCRSVDLFILGQARRIFFGSSLLKKQFSHCLLRGSLAYISSWVLINTQHVKSVWIKS